MVGVAFDPFLKQVRPAMNAAAMAGKGRVRGYQSHCNRQHGGKGENASHFNAPFMILRTCAILAFFSTRIIFSEGPLQIRHMRRDVGFTSEG